MASEQEAAAERAALILKRYASANPRLRAQFWACILPAVAISFLTGPALAADIPSICHGRPAAGRIEHAVQLPLRGPNFEAYSQLGIQLGRTYVHSTVRDIVLQTYAEMQKSRPQVELVYGETGLKEGGPMPPHRTHQAGTSLDFLVPVKDRNGQPALLPRSGFVEQIERRPS